ncbi:MAG: hypothetical protein FWE17_01815 [Alphaproteobacteria bacterium]|nr:hypothetical protein [Alphaproteobacteria bacterium]MCL2758049.1 hypothetical protein [Alphaproteobacteria bacterium]
MKNILVIFIAAAALAACTFQTRQRGYVFPHDLEEQIAKVRTVADLEERFGSPQARTVHGPLVWIYYGATENLRGPLPLTWDNRTVLLAWIDPPSPGASGAASGGRVTKTRILRDEDLPDARIAAGSTPIPAEIELNMLQELINNVGRFTPAGLGQ